MKIFDRITLRTLCRATEEEKKVAEALIFAAGGREREIELTELEGYGGSPLKMMRVEIARQQEIKAFWGSLPKNVIKELLHTLDERMDEGNSLHFRLDKENAYLGELSIAYGGAVISVEAKVLSYPADREDALRNAGEYLKNLL